MKDILIGLAIGLLSGLLVGGGVFYFRRSRVDQSQDTEQTSPLPTSQPEESETEEEPTATPEPTQAVEKGDLAIQVLNGSGAPGAAGDGRDYLEELGYENISVGNADSYAYEQTEVYVKEGKKDILQELIEDLKEEYEVSVQSEYLDEDSDYDIRIIIGAS